VLIIEGYNEMKLNNANKREYFMHSIVAGGFEVTSYTIRLTFSTSLTIRTEIFSSTSQEIRTQSTVMPPIDITARMPTM